MTTLNKVKVIKEQLEQVQARILENEKLQKEFPKQKRGLLIALTTLKQLEKEMIDALKDEYVTKNNEVYEVLLTGNNLKGNIPLKDAGEMFIDEQNLFTTFAVEEALPKTAQIPPNIIRDTQMILRATAGSSFKIIVTGPQKVLYNVDDAETPVKRAFNDIKELIRIGSNKELLKTEESRLGSKKITAYRNLLNILYEKNMNLEISTRTSDRKDLPIFSIKKEDARNIYNALIEKTNPTKNVIEMTGVLKGIDVVREPYFKIITEHDKKKKVNRIYFTDDLLDNVLKHMKKLSKINVQIMVKERGVGGKPFLKNHLINFVDD